MCQQYTYRGLCFLGVKILERVQGTIGLDFRDRMSRGHLDTQSQSVGNLSSRNAAHLDTGGFTIYEDNKKLSCGYKHTFINLVIFKFSSSPSLKLLNIIKRWKRTEEKEQLTA